MKHLNSTEEEILDLVCLLVSCRTCT